MKVFVIGAEGMLGSSICRELIAQGYQVKASALSADKIQTIKDLPINIVFGNILDKDFLNTTIRGCDFIINVAAITNVWPNRSKKVRDVNYLGVQNLVEAAKLNNCKRMIQIGTANSFDHGCINKQGNESNSFSNRKYRLDYIDSKYEAQQFLIREFLENNFPVLIVNPTYMIGPYDSGPTSGKMILELVNNNLPAYTNGGKNFVDSRDVAKAVVNALKLGQLGECYIAGNENLSYKEFFMKVNKTSGTEFKLKRAPKFLIFTIGCINSLVAFFTKKPPQLSLTMARLACIDQFYSSQKAIQILQMPQTPIEEAISACLEWYENNGLLNKVK